jgi:hypothetical protein
LTTADASPPGTIPGGRFGSWDESVM